jgi:hypothetical protein
MLPIKPVGQAVRRAAQDAAVAEAAEKVAAAVDSGDDHAYSIIGCQWDKRSSEMKWPLTLLVFPCIALMGCSEDTPPPAHHNPLGGMRPATGLQSSDGRSWRPEKDPMQTSNDNLPAGMMRNPDGSITYGGSSYRPR